MRALAVILVVVALVVAGSWMWWRDENTRLSQPAAERALQQRLHTSYRFSCKRVTNDGSISGLDDVDYLCEPVGHPSLNGYFIATDAHRITGLQPTG
ncbi:MAG: hypothetical protein ACYDCH_02230 [Gaiellaceae bacterium]